MGVAIADISINTGASSRSDAVYGHNGMQTGQSFRTTNTSDITGVTIYVDALSGSAGNWIVELQSNGSSEPSGTVLATSAEKTGASTSAGNQYNMTFTTAYTPTANTDYWIVVRRTSVDTTGNFWEIYDSSGSDTYAAGRLMRKESGTWQTKASTLDARMVILIEPPQTGNYSG